MSTVTETADSPHLDRESPKRRPGSATPGTTAAWYRGVQTCHEGELSAGRLQRGVVFAEAGTHAREGSGLDDALDAAYRGKYGRSSSAVARITADVARATALRVDPA